MSSRVVIKWAYFYPRSSLIQTFESWIYYTVEFGDYSPVFFGNESFRNSKFSFYSICEAGMVIIERGLTLC